ncbi:Female germline-specific tumor suppressor gld-1 [Gracilariopsis chorda]|uniref:Female germline-specific tumor suppressor gld-1 n=1 Tax=Gracilariopsis chorda TaxID=448386 RepID=A0A2V3IKH8_9FLOR|nr:Female germline-specific tumor suppressor gld-1 [Gracilariopsis chorda]|eukprot:PXF42549.1 Female germline-specific tumor suppressor gld-1 [Gracilariopsis chorda]
MAARALFLSSPTSSPTPSPARSPPPRPSAARLLAQLLRERDRILPFRASLPNLVALLDAEIARARAATPSTHPRKRVKLPVPSDKFPDYNFVGRLLGPRGTTLRTLERDTGCRIMIRGKGSIRKDKEPDVRGKPGWEHVFNEPLHVVIEAPDGLQEPSASAALARAADAVELLLVPVPEERDALKRHQLRALAIMNGTYRGAPHAQYPIPYPIESEPLAPLPSPILSAYDSLSMLLEPTASLRKSPSSTDHFVDGACSIPVSTPLVNLPTLNTKLRAAASLDEFGSSSVGDDTPESSHGSEHDDAAPSTSASNLKLPTGTALGVGGFMGHEFYNGAFSNGASSPTTTWDQTVSSSAPFASAFGAPSPHVLTSTSTVTPLQRRDDVY